MLFNVALHHDIDFLHLTVTVYMSWLFLIHEHHVTGWHTNKYILREGGWGGHIKKHALTLHDNIEVYASSAAGLLLTYSSLKTSTSQNIDF